MRFARKLTLVAALVLTVASCSPKMLPYAPMREIMASDPAQLNGNYRPYVFTDWDDKSVEKDYEAFYISHYGRHGSRYCTTKGQYARVYNVLSSAAEEDNLTPTGEAFWKEYQELYKAADGNAALLTDIGRAEHSALGKEMYTHYSSVFKPGGKIFACSTPVERVIESMNLFLGSITAEVPDMDVSKRSEEEDFRFLNGNHETNPRATEVDFNNASSKNKWQDDWNALAEVVDVKSFIDRIFKDGSKLGFKDNGLTWTYGLYNVIADAPCVGYEFAHMPDYIPLDVRYGLWRAYNLRNYKICGPDCKTTGGRQWAIREVLLRDFVERADEDLRDGVAARLRFGHDWPVAALLPLMDAEGWNCPEDDPFKVENVFSCSKITMASNMQMIFFRPKKGGEDYIVRIMFNGHDVNLPIKHFRKNYYKWTVLRAYLQERIDIAGRILDGETDARTTLSGKL